jgi:Fe-S cluster assembly protein SufD
MTAVAEQIGQWLDFFNAQGPAAEPWIQALREGGFALFSQTGFPTTHDEEWRFTNVAPIARGTFRLVPASPVLSIPEGVRQLPLEQAELHLGHYAVDRNAFVALNTAFIGEVAVIEVPRNAVIEQPIEISHVGTDGTTAHPRTLIVVGANAQCTIVETYKGTGSYFTNAVTEIVVGESAVVDHYKVQQESISAWHVATLQASIGRSAVFTSHSISLGGALVRNDANAVLSTGAEGTLNGLYIVNGTQHVDNHTIIDHAQPHAVSHEVYKGILDGKSHAVFNGKIFVRKDAQKTDSKQTNKNLVLSDDAVVDTKPELQILADDVRCTHGATIGQLDSEALFYLQSRGIGRSDAKSLLTFAFAQDIVDRIKVQSLRDSLERILFEKFHEHAE